MGITRLWPSGNTPSTSLESHPLARLSLVQVLLAGPSWSECWVLPGFGPLAITSLPVLLESHPLARFFLLVGSFRLDVSRLRSSGDHPSFVGPVLGITRLWSTGNNLILAVRCYQALGLWQLPFFVVSGITRLWSSGNDPTFFWSLTPWFDSLIVGYIISPGFWSSDDTTCWSLVH